MSKIINEPDTKICLKSFKDFKQILVLSIMPQQPLMQIVKPGCSCRNGQENIR